MKIKSAFIGLMGVSFCLCFFNLANITGAQTIPKPSSSDLWDVTKNITILTNSPLFPGFNIKGMFGGSSQETIFSDYGSTGTIHFVEWKTVNPVRLYQVRLFAAGDGPTYNYQRECDKFVLKAKKYGSSAYDVVVVSNSFNHPYPNITVSDQLLLDTSFAPVFAQEFRAEFSQYNSSRPFNGPRVLELDGFGDQISVQGPGLIGFWRGEGNTLDDLGFNSAVSTNNISFVPGKAGQAFAFSGIDSGIDLGILPITNLQSFTLEAWLNPIDLEKPQSIFSFGNSDGLLGVFMAINTVGENISSSGSLYANVRDTDFTNHALATQSGVISTSAWNHVALTFDQLTGIARLFVNGIQQTNKILGNLSPNLQLPLHFGTMPTASSYLILTNYQGNMDEVSLYARPLSEEEIKIIYLGGANAKRLLAYPVTDGIPILWRLSNFGDNFDTDPRSSALNDPDNDGANNYQEYLAGTNPLEPNSDSPTPLLLLSPQETMFTNSISITMSSPVTNGIIFFTRDGQTPGINSLRYQAPVPITSSTVIKACVFVNGYPVSSVLTVNYERLADPVSIITQPKSQIVSLGTNVQIKVSVSGTPPISFQWYFNGNQIAQATNSSLTFASFQITNFGIYTVEVSNRRGNIMSDQAIISSDKPLPFVYRQLPTQYMPGVKFTVTLEAKPPTNTLVYAVEDKMPAGWLAENASNGGIYDDVNKLVKFGPFLDADVRLLTYDVIPASIDGGMKQFIGSASADGSQTEILGQSELNSPNFHPADTNPSDWRMSIAEMTAYSAAWKRGEAWPLPPNPISINYMTQAALLWKKGENYDYDPFITDAPYWWFNLPPIPQSQINHGVNSQVRKASVASSALAQSPKFYSPGKPLQVKITVQPGANTVVYAVEDMFPADCQISEISSDGCGDNNGKKVKWGPFFDNQTRTFTYQVTPVDTSKTIVFSGLASFNGGSIPISGQRSVSASVVSMEGPRISSVSRSGSNFEMTLSGPVGQVYQIEVSPDLSSWTPVETVTNISGILKYSPPANSSGKLFYRAVLK